jgi:hypothetical protein
MELCLSKKVGSGNIAGVEIIDSNRERPKV